MLKGVVIRNQKLSLSILIKYNLTIFLDLFMLEVVTDNILAIKTFPVSHEQFSGSIYVKELVTQSTSNQNLPIHLMNVYVEFSLNPLHYINIMNSFVDLYMLKSQLDNLSAIKNFSSLSWTFFWIHLCWRVKLNSSLWTPLHQIYHEQFSRCFVMYV